MIDLLCLACKGVSLSVCQQEVGACLLLDFQLNWHRFPFIFFACRCVSQPVGLTAQASSRQASGLHVLCDPTKVYHPKIEFVPEYVSMSTTMPVCLDCKTSTTPCWREGPKGPRTLCNACGIKWKRSTFGTGSRPRRKKEKVPSAPKQPPDAEAIASTFQPPKLSRACTGTENEPRTGSQKSTVLKPGTSLIPLLRNVFRQLSDAEENQMRLGLQTEVIYASTAQHFNQRRINRLERKVFRVQMKKRRLERRLAALKLFRSKIPDDRVADALLHVRRGGCIDEWIRLQPS